MEYTDGGNGCNFFWIIQLANALASYSRENFYRVVHATDAEVGMCQCARIGVPPRSEQSDPPVKSQSGISAAK